MGRGIRVELHETARLDGETSETIGEPKQSQRDRGNGEQEAGEQSRKETTKRGIWENNKGTDAKDAGGGAACGTSETQYVQRTTTQISIYAFKVNEVCAAGINP